jgi:hypothetical protein
MLSRYSRPHYPNASRSSLSTEFQLAYGHVLAQKLSLSHSTRPPSDVSEAVQVLLVPKSPLVLFLSLLEV